MKKTAKTFLTTAALAAILSTPAIASDKSDFLATVDESISGERIAGNPFKFVGKNVDLHCTVANIPAADVFNASCPDANVVILHSTRDLEQGQAVRVIGTVQDPMDGTNAMGGEMQFPTVLARFLQ